MTLEVRGLVLAYGAFRVLDDLSLTLPSDGLVGMIGPNGAGKSTLFSVISGFMRAQAGEVLFRGQRIDTWPEHRRARLGLCRTFQVPREFAHLSLLDNLMAAPAGQAGESMLALMTRARRVRREEAALRDKAMQWLEFLGLAALAGQAAGRLSGGQKKLLELGRLLMLEPRCVLLDEPYAGVNPVLIEQLSARIGALHARGIGFVIVEHNLQKLARLVQRLVVLDRGRLIADGAPAAVLDDARVREAYLGG